MRTLLVAAMPTESRAMIKQYAMAIHSRLASFFPLYKARDQELYLVLTHVGMTNAATGTALAIAAIHPDAILKVGCVGGNAPRLRKNDRILATQFFHAGAWMTRSQTDMSPTERASLWLPLFGDLPYQNNQDNLGGLDYVLLPDPALTRLCIDAFAEQKMTYHSAALGSSDMVITDHIFMEHIRSDLLHLEAGALWCTDNESYSVMQVCRIYNVPAMGVYFVASSDYEDIDGYDPAAIDQQTSTVLMPALTALLEKMR